MEEINIKEEVYKCSKCGLCKSVCPVFYALKNEMYLPRGRYNVLNKFFNGGEKFSKQFVKDLDICLNCNACRRFCPSAINSAEIFTALKSIYYKPLIPFYFKYRIILIMHSIKKLFIKNPLYKINIKKFKFSEKNKAEKTKIVYFQGCFNKYINPSDKNAALKLLDNAGYNVLKVLGSCCGQMYLTDGNLKKFKKNAAKILKSIPAGAEYIVCSCDSCYETLKSALLDNRIVRLEDIIKIEMPPADGGTVYHKPYARSEYKGNIPAVNNKYSCSLMENFFMLKHKKEAEKMLESVFYKKEDIDGKTVTVSCNLTKYGLIENCIKKGINTRIISFSEAALQQEQLL